MDSNDEKGPLGSEGMPQLMYVQNGEQFLVGNNVSTLQPVVFIDENGCLREGFQEVKPRIIFAGGCPVDDDVETPSHVLDHMYAKKPKEPGSEPVNIKPKRKSKKKEQVIKQFVVPSEPPQQTPKINIIRQHIPRPKILQGGSVVTKTKRLVSSQTKEKMKSIANNVLGRTIQNHQEVKPCIQKLQKGVNASNNNNNNNNAKSTSMLEDLQPKTESYDDEMLFDLGIPEDDVVNRCSLSTEEFGDTVFGDCAFEGLEVYNSSVLSQLHNTCNSNSLSRSLESTGGLLIPKSDKPEMVIGAQLSSDEDDNDQVMVSMESEQSSTQSEGSSVPSAMDTGFLSFKERLERDADTLAIDQKPSFEMDLDLSAGETFKKATATSSSSSVITPQRRSSRSVKTPKWLNDSSMEYTSKRKRR